MVLVTYTWPEDDRHTFVALAVDFWHAKRVASNVKALNTKLYRDSLGVARWKRATPSLHFAPILHLTEV
jgi:hypothetical protein